MSEPGNKGDRGSTRGEILPQPGSPSRESTLRRRWRAARQSGLVLYYSYLTSVLVAPILAYLLGGPGWGRGLAVACGTLWFFCGYDKGVGLYALVVHQLVLLGLMIQFFYYGLLAK